MVVRHSRALIVLLVAGMISCEPAEFGSGSAPADDTAQSSTVDATADPTAGPAAGPTAGPAADAVADRPGDETGTPPLTPDGWGAMRIGMTLEELTAVAGPAQDLADARSAVVNGRYMAAAVARGATALDLPVPAARDTGSNEPFKGDMDVDALRRVLSDPDTRVPLVILTVTNNSGGNGYESDWCTSCTPSSNSG